MDMQCRAWMKDREVALIQKMKEHTDGVEKQAEVVCIVDNIVFGFRKKNYYFFQNYNICIDLFLHLIQKHASYSTIIRFLDHKRSVKNNV